MTVHPAPRAHTAGQRNQAAAQEAQIRDMLARGVDDPTIAAAVGCTLARVRDVTHRPTPAQPTIPPQPAAPTGGVHGLTPSALLDVAAAHDDPRINRHAAHIRNDLAILRDLLTDHQEREQLATRLIGLDAHTDRLWAANAARHRRATDREPQP